MTQNSSSRWQLWRQLAVPVFVLLVWSNQRSAVTLTFDEAISGEVIFEFDADSDAMPDAVFTTTDPGGFNTVGPGPNQLYIDEPGLEGTTTLPEDLRVDFPNGAVDSLGFGFAVSGGPALRLPSRFSMPAMACWPALPSLPILPSRTLQIPAAFPKPWSISTFPASQATRPLISMMLSPADTSSTTSRARLAVPRM